MPFSLMHRAAQTRPLDKRLSWSELAHKLVREHQINVLLNADVVLTLDELCGLFCTGSEIVVEKLVESKAKEAELLESVKFSFNVESLGLTLYNNDPTQVSID